MQVLSKKWLMVAAAAACLNWPFASRLLADSKLPTSSPDDLIRFDRDVAPILAENCYRCHGPDASQRQAGLRLDTRQGALAELDSGERAIVPSDVTASSLVQRITDADPDQRMPPAGSNKSLTAGQIQTLKSWIDQGASWDRHWAFESPRATSIPSVGDTFWSVNPIDRFILSRLEQSDIRPSPRANRRTLIRRLYLDLIGLPVSPEDVQAFVEDRRPDAYVQLVDRLLASPRYGERWGRHWLDVARYGDSNGSDENHSYPLAFHYRNYVIRSMNEDLPYDRFLHQQLAGDLLPASQSLTPDADRLTATGFLAIGTKILAEQDKVKMRADMVDEQIDTFGRAILGITLGCARCHDHKASHHLGERQQFPHGCPGKDAAAGTGSCQSRLECTAAAYGHGCQG